MMIDESLSGTAGCTCNNPYKVQGYYQPMYTSPARAMSGSQTVVGNARALSGGRTLSGGTAELNETISKMSLEQFNKFKETWEALTGVVLPAPPHLGGKTHEQRMDELEQKWAEARAKAQSPEYANQQHGQGSDLPEKLEGPLILATMTELAHWISTRGWVYCTMQEWLNGTPSEDDLGLFSSVKSAFTAPTLEQHCGDESYGDQYADAFELLSASGAPARLVKLIKERGAAKYAMKKEIFKKDAEQNITSATKATLEQLNPLNPFGAIGKYLFLAAGGYLLFLYLKGKAEK